jgi:alpha-L-arabinofuranosidase B-like protein
MFDHHPRSDARTGREIIPWSAAGAGLADQEAARASTARARRVLVACAVAVAAGVTGLMTLIYPAGDVPPEPVPGGFVFPDLPEPSAAVSLLPAPSSASTPSPVPTPPTTRVATAVPGRTARPGPTGASRPPTTAPALRFTVGSTVGLELDGKPGYRVRHHDFLGRVDRISTAQDRADSQFRVRTGFGPAGCVSLEAVNYPGYFLRHRYFVLRLEPAGRRENPQLFAQDTTFCPAPVGDGTAYVLKSVNYPGRALALHSDGVLHLDPGGATAFRVRKPL